MCKFQQLAERDDGEVRLCTNCQSYRLIYKNLVFTFNRIGLENFKDNIEFCYQENLEFDFDPDERHIVFDTRLRGFQFLFSLQEVGGLMSLIQEAMIQESFLPQHIKKDPNEKC
ncbi:MAG: DUF6686 family protein [Bacteroidota bacterium]